jgi:2-polyprenyl-3-methyl-5-hydroxy-6-metoxy-1,4-benzoquinol methylase
MSEIMADFTICNLCAPPGNFDNATEVMRVRSNVRKFQGETFTVWRCSRCGSLHSKEAVCLDYYYQHYPINNHQMDGVTRLAYQNRLRALQRCCVGKRAKFLDYGCGHGVFVSFLDQCGYEAYGYDAYVDSYADERALDASYDVITAYDVIEHVDDPGALFRQLIRYLNPGGLLVIGTPAADQLDLADTESFIMELHQPYHRHILSEKALLWQGTSAGLEVVKVDRRSCYDTLYPFLNARFGKAYLRLTGNVLDSVFEEPRLGRIFTSPRLLFYALAGYFLPPPGNITAFFRLKQT